MAERSRDEGAGREKEAEPLAPCHRRLDTRGSFCPVPVIETAAAMRDLAAGEILEVLADDVGAKLDLRAWCRSHHQRLLSIDEDRRVIRVRIMKTGDIA